MKNYPGRMAVYIGTLFLLMLMADLGYAQTPPTTIRGVTGGLNPCIKAIAIDQNGNVYVGGSFSQAGNIYANNIAMWSPVTRTWSRLETTPTGQGSYGVGGQVNSIVIGSDGKVYVGGQFGSVAGGFITAKNVGVWNPANQTWSNLGGGVYDNVTPDQSFVNSIALDGDYLYVGGKFSRAGSGILVDNIAFIRLSFSQWSALGNPGITVERVRRRWNPQVGGTFTYISGIGGVYYSYTSEIWQSTDPTPNGIDDSIYGTVKDFLFPAPYTNYRYDGGYFRLTSQVGIPPDGNNINFAAFYGSCWVGPGGIILCNYFHPVANGPSGLNDVYAMAAFQDGIIVVGNLDFTIQQSPYETGRNVAFLHETLAVGIHYPPTSHHWSILGTGPNNGVNGPAFAVAAVGGAPNGFVYVGGQFSEAGDGICADNIAVWDAANNTWAALSPNAAPTVEISSAVFSSPATITINATADDDCTVEKVDFYQNGNLLGTDDTAPYSFTWNNVPLGTYSLTAKATDNEGAETTSAVVSVVAHSDPAADFSLAGNPNGPWSYGYSETLGAPLILHATSGSDGDLDYWDTTGLDGYGLPRVAHNPTAAPVIWNTAVIAPGALSLHPGPNGEVAILRFTVPSDGQYLVNVAFFGQDNAGPTTTDVHVLHDGTSIFDDVVSDFGTSHSFNTTLTLTAGSQLDFAVGFGNDLSYYYDSTGLSASITPVPFDPAADFSLAGNPNGPWSYGYSETLGAPLNLHATSGSDGDLDYWGTTGLDGYGLPRVAHNPTAAPVNWNTAVIAPGALSLHPGPNGEVSILRFTAPWSGQYLVNAAFFGQDSATTDVHVLHDGTSIFDDVVSDFGTSHSFNTTLTLTAGSQLDFAVGFGGVIYYYDSTGLSVSITPVP